MCDSLTICPFYTRGEKKKMPNTDSTIARLDKLKLQPSKNLGQNFLTDPEVAKWIVRQLGARAEDTVIEIGPGLGALTEHLVDSVGRLILIEVDGRLAGDLEARYAERTNVEILHADATQLDLRPFFKYGPLKVIGNLPYSSGTEIVRHFLENPSPVESAVFMLQTEVAARMGAAPGKKSYGVLSLRIQSGWRTKIVRELTPEPFYPQPTVGSAVMVVEKRAPDELPVFDRRLFDRLIRQGFAQRRKQLKKLLPAPPAGGWTDVCAAVDEAETVRGEALTLEKWITLTNFFDPHPLKDNAQSADEIFDVVDETNTVIAQVPRGEVHAKGLRHRAVHIFVLNKHGEIFLQKRSHLKDACAGLWDSSAAGHLDAGESYADCAVRELEEELGVSAEMRQMGEIAACEATGWEFVELFEADHNGPFTWPASEISGGRFFSVSIIQEWIEKNSKDFAPGFVVCMKLWLQNCEKLSK